MTFPTVMALDGDELIGLLATKPSKEAVMIGPVAVKKGYNRGWVAVNLLNAYEGVLRWIGVTKYLIPVKRSDEGLVNAVGRLLEQEPFAADNDEMWFSRDLTNA